MKVLDLFSGIGGFSLGLERAGYETVSFCEIEPFCQEVLKKNWPLVPIHADITKLDGRQYAGAVDVVCGGFPCQDISCARANQIGLKGKRSGLWSEMHRIISEIRPRYVIVENVGQLLSGGKGEWFGQILSDLAAIGYDAEWRCIRAKDIGGPHWRKRVWIIAYPSKIGRDDGVFDYLEYEIPAYKEWDVQKDFKHGEGWKHWVTEVSKASDGYISQSDFCAVDDGLPEELDAIAALGNAVIPQIPEAIGRAIHLYELM